MTAERGSAHPWDFPTARQATINASRSQQAAEEFLRTSAREHAAAERAYRTALAARILQAHADGVAWTVASDVARGDKNVAQLRYERDVAEGVREAAGQAAWRAAADRRDVGRFVDWSLRADLRDEQTNVLPARRAA